jgi:hypothetical protein
LIGMRGDSESESSGINSLILGFLGVLLLACASSGPPVPPSAQLEWKIEQWFAQLAMSPPDLGREDRLFEGSSLELEFELAEGGDPGPGDLRAWLLDLRSPHHHVEFQLHDSSVSKVGDRLHRIRFEVERRAVGEDGMPHVARSLQTWLIHEGIGSSDTVVRVESVPLLAFPGTGPQIVCF